mmetsp:Transcript_94658/g.158932  ORF Transcript_94658/g.158932 Transcript_94658/m.158932 type:complete len:113 (-) Transcript_94658:990-1328(-)
MAADGLLDCSFQCWAEHGYQDGSCRCCSADAKALPRHSFMCMHVCDEGATEEEKGMRLRDPVLCTAGPAKALSSCCTSSGCKFSIWSKAKHSKKQWCLIKNSVLAKQSRTVW